MEPLLAAAGRKSSGPAQAIIHQPLAAVVNDGRHYALFEVGPPSGLSFPPYLPAPTRWARGFRLVSVAADNPILLLFGRFFTPWCPPGSHPATQNICCYLYLRNGKTLGGVSGTTDRLFEVGTCLVHCACRRPNTLEMPKMKARYASNYLVVAALAALPTVSFALDFEITSTVQAELDRQKSVIAGWAADPIVVKAVQEQNKKGPIAGMDKAKWKGTRRSDPIVKGFQTNPAGKFLRSKMRASNGTATEVFLNAAKGEKVAFAEKTSSYVHAGAAKHDVPFTTGKPWQGKPEFDESTQTYAIQISTPVLAGGTPIGSLVVGVSLAHFKSASR